LRNVDGEKLDRSRRNDWWSDSSHSQGLKGEQRRSLGRKQALFAVLAHSKRDIIEYRGVRAGLLFVKDQIEVQQGAESRTKASLRVIFRRIDSLIDGQVSCEHVDVDISAIGFTNV
jgi:hypothetical protein